MDVAIIGSGIAGLSTALCIARFDPKPNTKVTVYEAASALSELGAGLQISANGTRVFYALGLGEAFKNVANDAKVLQIRRYANDTIIGEIPQNPFSEWDYGFPHWQIYRPDFQRLLAEACQTEESIKLVLGKKAVSVDHETATITFASGETASHDIVIAADGINGRVRNSIPEVAESGITARPFKEYCLRAIVPKERMFAAGPEVAALMERHSLNTSWLGPKMVMLGYPVAAGDFYNIVLSVPRPADEKLVGRWGQPGDVKEGAKLLEDFCERTKKVWSLVEECHKWTLGDLPPLPSFVSENGKVVVIGDAAHAILPYAGNGGGQALEDAASLAILLNSVSDFKQDLPQAMAAWNGMRMERMEGVRRWASGNQSVLTLSDGPEQQARDQGWSATTAAWKKEFENLGEDGWKKKPKPEAVLKGDDIRSPEMKQWLYGYDVIDHSRRIVQEFKECAFVGPSDDDDDDPAALITFGDAINSVADDQDY